MTDDTATLVKLVSSLEAEFGVPAGFIRTLLTEDDWSFTIKAQALVEAAITQLVLAALGRDSLSEPIEAAPLGGRYGKLAMARSLAIVDPDLCRFADLLGQLRNSLV